MPQINELSNIAKPALHMEQGKNGLLLRNANRVGFIKARSINLSKIANAFSSKAESESRYRRMQRFIHDYPIKFDRVPWFKWLKSKLTLSGYYP